VDFFSVAGGVVEESTGVETGKSFPGATALLAEPGASEIVDRCRLDISIVASRNAAPGEFFSELAESAAGLSVGAETDKAFFGAGVVVAVAPGNALEVEADSPRSQTSWGSALVPAVPSPARVAVALRATDRATETAWALKA
jgi:hypothetical protein